MIGLFVSTFAFTVIVTVLVALLVAVSVVPVFAALQMADTRRFSTGRWGALSSAAVLIGLGLAYELHKRDGTPRLVAVLPLVFTWAGPAMLWLLDAGQTRLGGRAGVHE